MPKWHHRLFRIACNTSFRLTSSSFVNQENTMKYTTKALSLLTSVTFAMTAASTAFADCADMENNSPEWSDLSTKLTQSYSEGKFEDALNYGKRLLLICNRSPVVNFTVSEIYRKLGNNEESYNYVRRASEFIIDYPVPQQVAERIWMRRAEDELPYKKQLEELRTQLETGTGEYGSRQQKLVNSAYTSEMKLEHEKQRSLERLNDELSFVRTTKWIGAGAAIGGVVLAGAGAGLLAYNYGKASDNYGSSWKNFDDKDAMVHGSIAMLAGGLGLGIAGTAVAIVSYVKEMKLEYISESENNAQAAEPVAVKFDVAPNSIVFGMTF